jgi:cytochrome P450
MAAACRGRAVAVRGVLDGGRLAPLRAAPPARLRPPAGHIPALLSPRAPFVFAEWAEACGPVTRLRMGATPLLLVSDPAEAAKLLRRGASYIPKSREIYAALEIGVEPRTPNMLTANDGPMWKSVRTCVAPAFSATSLKQVRGGGVAAVRRWQAGAA